MSLDGMEQYFSRYTDVSDVRIFWSGLLGMIGITLETMSFFGVYRIIASKSESYAHAYRAGLHGNIARIEAPAKDMPIWLDVSMKRFEYVHPAGGNEFTSAKITPDELEKV